MVVNTAAKRSQMAHCYRSIHHVRGVTTHFCLQKWHTESRSVYSTYLAVFFHLPSQVSNGFFAAFVGIPSTTAIQSNKDSGYDKTGSSEFGIDRL